jgi:hypothetical protein
LNRARELCSLITTQNMSLSKLSAVPAVQSPKMLAVAISKLAESFVAHCVSSLSKPRPVAASSPWQQPLARFVGAQPFPTPKRFGAKVTADGYPDRRDSMHGWLRLTTTTTTITSSHPTVAPTSSPQQRRCKQVNPRAPRAIANDAARATIGRLLGRLAHLDPFR